MGSKGRTKSTLHAINVKFDDSKKIDISWLQMSYGSNGVRSLHLSCCTSGAPNFPDMWALKGHRVEWKYSWLWTQIRLRLNPSFTTHHPLNKKFMFYVPLCSKPQSTALYKKENTPGQILYSSWSSVLSSPKHLWKTIFKVIQHIMERIICGKYRQKMTVMTQCQAGSAGWAQSDWSIILRPPTSNWLSQNIRMRISTYFKQPSDNIFLWY